MVNAVFVQCGRGTKCPLEGDLTFDGSTGIVGSVTEDSGQHLGEWLRKQREELGIGLEQAEEDTRIRVRYLVALETDDFDSLPDPAVGRGFLRNYAAYLNLDPQVAIERFSELVAPPEPEPVPGDEPSPFDEGPFRPVPLHGIPGRGSGRGVVIAVLVVLIAALAVVGWWAYPKVLDLWQSGEGLAFLPRATDVEPTESVALPIATRTATQESRETNTPLPVLSSDTTETTASTTPTDTAVPMLTYTPSPSPTPSPPVYTGIFLELVLTDTSWIQVSVDGIRQFQGTLETDAYQSWYGENRIVLRGGNAGAVVVTLNGQNIGPLGKPGEVVDRVYEKVGDQVGELTVTPGPTWTPTPEQPPATATAPPSVTAAVTTPAPAPTESSPSKYLIRGPRGGNESAELRESRAQRSPASHRHHKHRNRRIGAGTPSTLRPESVVCPCCRSSGGRTPASPPTDQQGSDAFSLRSAGWSPLAWRRGCGTHPLWRAGSRALRSSVAGP